MTLVGRWKKTGLIAACLLAGAITLGAPVASANHPTIAAPGELGLSEAELVEAETEVLGAEHAAEHAKARALAEGERTSTGPGGGAVQSRLLEPRLAGPPAQVGQWGAPFAIPIFGINSVVLPTGKVMWWSYPLSPEARKNTSEAWLWDPATGDTTKVNPPLGQDYDGDGELDPANIWCSGQSMLADGRVLVTGGNLEYATNGPDDWKGLNKVYTFNPFNETWTEQPSMQHGRWYPSQVLLPDGRTAIMSGWDESGTETQAKEIELFTPSPNMNGVGTLTTIATRGGSGPPEGELYPRMFGMPSGRTMVAGPDPNDTWYFNPVGAAPGNAFSWSQRADFSDSRLWSTSFLEPGGPAGSSKVTITGGRPYGAPSSPLRTAITFDDANPGGGWQAAPSLNIGRAHHNTVLLPDGSKLAVGGGVGSRAPEGQYSANVDQRQVEIFDRASGTWNLGASQAEGRAYHSTAVLLPDGRVISAGDNYNGGTTSDSAEIYEPPYLFKGARPTIGSAPVSVNWGDEFGINSPDPVSRAVLMAPAATTHGYDMNQRHVELQVTGTVTGTGVNVNSPPTGNVAPPGYYMLYLLNGQDVPSVARWVKIDPSAPDRPLINPGGTQRTLTVTPPTGTGTGTITGTGINCPGDCSETYPDGTAVTLTANPTGGSSFGGWSGDCSGTAPCALTMNANKAVSGSFSSSDIPPTAVNDSATRTEDASAASIPVLANDTDPDGGPKTISSASDPAHGTVALTGGSAGSHTGLTYAPDPNYCGPDSFTYTLNGGSTATVSITVTCVDDAPTAVNDSATRTEDSAPATIPVLSNDTDPDGGPKTISSASDPAHGTVAVAGDGLSLTYAPDSNYCGPDSFTYTLNGGSTATVSITVNCADDAPVAVDDSATRTEDASAASIPVLANDTDTDGGPKTISSASDPAHGTVALTGGSAGSHTGLTYAPDPNYCGPDSFTYTLNGGSTATVSITVTCVDDPPVAVNDYENRNEDSAAASIPVLANDTDTDGGPKTISSASDPAHGTVALTGGSAGSHTGLTYAPDPNYCGPDSFTYTLNGGSTATVFVTVICADDDPPVAVDDVATVAEDSSPVAIGVLSNDTDPDGGPKTISSASEPAHGTVAVAGDGLSLTYAPDSNYCGPDSFTYTLIGGSTATVLITVTCVDDLLSGSPSASVVSSTGKRASALKNCKKKKRGKPRKQCKMKANRLPI